MTSPEPHPPVSMLMSALWWANKDVPILPLHYPIDGACSCGRSGCDNPAKHPIASLVPKGLNDATTDPELIRDWWVQYPTANIGGRTGVVFDLLDIDTAEGVATFQNLVTEIGAPENLGVVRSGRLDSGLHVYPVPGGQKALTGGKTSPPGIDVKGRGGYAVLPPSLHISGRRYEWIDQRFHSGEIRGDATWDTFYQRLVVKPKQPPIAPRPRTEIHPDAADAYGRAVLARAVGLVRATSKGHRWQTLAVEAIPLVARGIDGGCIDRDSGIRELEDAGRGVGLDGREVGRIAGLVDNMLAAGITHPIRPKEAAAHTELTVLYETEDEARADPWDPPWPLRHPTPPFPVEVMGWMEKPILELSEQLQVPVDLVAMMTIATVAAAIRGRIRVEVIPGWEEPLNLYVAVALKPGETKSPALSRILAPLRAMEEKARVQAAQVIADRQFNKDFAEERAKRLRDKALKASGESYEVAMARDEARRAAEEAEAITVPVLPRWLLGGDTTPEALVEKLAEQGGALAHLSAEGELFDTIVGGRYSGGSPHLSSLLTAHDGREPILVHRKTADDVEIHNPCLTLGLAIQPQVLEQLGKVDAAVRRGLGARILYSVPASLVGRRDMTLSRGSGHIGHFETLIDRVDALAAGFGHFGHTEPGSEGVSGASPGSRGHFGHTLGGVGGSSSPLSDPGSGHIGHGALKSVFKDSSLSLFLRYREELEPRRAAETGDLGAIGAWANKLDGHLARLAAVLQVVHDARPDVSTPQPCAQNARIAVEPEAVAGALVLGDYLIAHAVEAHALMTTGERDTSPAGQLRGWLRQQGHTEFTVHEAQRSLRNRVSFRDPVDVHRACAELERLGWLRRLPSDPGPGRPSVRYLVHPEAHQ